MYDRILVPLDGSTAAESVLPYVEMMARQFGSDILLATVSEPGTGDRERLYRLYLDNVTERVRKAVQGVVGGKEPRVQGGILPGQPASEIVRYAGESHPSSTVKIQCQIRWFRISDRAFCRDSAIVVPNYSPEIH